MDTFGNCLVATRSTMSSSWRAIPKRMIIAVLLLATAAAAIFFRHNKTLLITFGSVGGVIILICVFILLQRLEGEGDQFLSFTLERFLNDLERERPTKFTSHHLMLATNNYSNMLGSGGFGSVYKGNFSDGTVVAVKVLRSGVSDKRMEEQFMAEVGTIGRVRHANLVRLFGFCIEKDTTALVYEYMGNGSLDKYLFGKNRSLAFEKLHEIAIGTAKGIAYLHEECEERIIHYDIKPENILLDDNLCPKVADFGLAKLCNREKSYVTMTGLRGTLGYVAPELWVPIRVTHKCDLYSFGMLLFEIIGRRRNVVENLTESQEWFPKWVWIKFKSKNLEELVKNCAIDEDKDKEMVERMVRIALWCAQYRPELRPKMSDVIKMLEGKMEVNDPPNPFQHLMEENHEIGINIDDGSSTLEGTRSSIVSALPVLEIQADPNPN